MPIKKLPQHISLLLADDDWDDRYFFEKAIAAIPAITKFKSVVDGEKLLNYLSENLDSLPDVIFLDQNMPRKNGKECLEELKNDQRLKDIPVVIYSTSLRNETTEILYEMGAHYYLQKCDFGGTYFLYPIYTLIITRKP